MNALQQRHNPQPGNKSANVSPPGNTASFGRSVHKRTLQELQQKPNAQENRCRKHHHMKEKEDGNNRQDRRPWVQQIIATHHAGDCAAGPDRRNAGRWRRPQLGETGSEPACQIEKQITGMSQSIFDVVPKDVQEP
jgi:hypothetical protein